MLVLIVIGSFAGLGISFVSAKDHKNSVINPVLIVEVLSESTAAYDRGDKFHFYRQIASFKEYVIIDQSKYIVDVYFKPESSDLWKISRFEGLDNTVHFQSMGIEITMRELYYRTNI